MSLLQRICLIILLFIINSTTITALKSSDIVILILSQENEYNSRIAHKLEQSILEQSNKEINKVYLSHRDFDNNGDWTILPLLPEIFFRHNDTKWLFICDEYTEINFKRLVQVLEKYNSSEDQWLGHSLWDNEATIIHHFAFYNDPKIFLYPNIPSGIAIPMPLLQKIVTRFRNNNLIDFDVEFNIDASHELSLFIWNNNTGFNLTHEPNFCVDYAENCATFVRDPIKCGPAVSNSAVYFAVKTYHKFHDNRLRFVQETWSKYIENIEYFSDITDTNIPTISFGIPNTENGHCAKYFAILNYANNVLQNNEGFKWLIILDDDTIISSYRLRKLLSCYKNSKYLALGEKYGFGVRTETQKGLNFMTGGSGTILSKDLVKKIVENSHLCFCNRIDSPDDMVLGLCLLRLGVKITHSHLFHQARPNDYNPKTISRNTISFHKHRNADPVKIYNNWFKNDDEKSLNTKTEL